MTSISLSPPLNHHHPHHYHPHFRRASFFGLKRTQSAILIANALSNNGAVPRSSRDAVALSRMVKETCGRRSNLESLFCYDKPIPEEIIEKPIGLGVTEKFVGDKSPCLDCQAKGVVLCSTCSGSGLYVDSILESQGIIVKVRCLGCGGTGNIMCSDCGGRGHSY